MNFVKTITVPNISRISQNPFSNIFPTKIVHDKKAIGFVRALVTINVKLFVMKIMVSRDTENIDKVKTIRLK